MSALQQFRTQLKPGRVYRREELLQFSSSVDRVLKSLLEARLLEKAGAGLYYRPKKSIFGLTPPGERELIEAFLKDRDYLLVSPNFYNSLGVRTTQLYNTTVVYNRKRHGHFTLAGKRFEFRMKPRFPKILSEEFLLVDLMNNLNSLSEDRELVAESVRRRSTRMNREKLLKAARLYGKVATRRFFESLRSK
ncbi:MAG: hypothetical protein EB078_05845 [Proteobacteria bacterium]|nr:hypothetical protein [Pseudomonadota bacterium]NDC22909.1 hypothetical protein [Pseudomonadota bacterium]NDD04408.1 hypothetical protein [Pseudomonadota bacterium]NDG26375.1 hypothetical protein [Pseudomonadota bacterium]